MSHGPRRICCVVFDCDGTLVDSEPLYGRADAVVLNQLGVPITENELIERFTGIDRKTILRTLQTDYRIALPPDIDARLDRQVEHEMLHGLKAMPSAADVLAELVESGARLAVASNSRLTHIRNALRVTGLERFFEGRIASAELVQAPKPAPDVYRLAAQMLSVPEARCVAIDDSPAGVRSARAAGMTVVGFAPPGHLFTHSQLDEAGAHFVIVELTELIPIVSA